MSRIGTKDYLLQTLKEVRPTAFFGVPRVWEKIELAMKAAGSNRSGCKVAMEYT